jgi:small-conductance mechanosensitive channel
MQELLIGLEFRRQALRRQLLRAFRQDGDRYFGVALIILGVSLVFPGFAVVAPVVPGVALVLALAGLGLICTLIAAPLGLILL